MGRITRRPRAGQDLIEIWAYIGDDDETAADAVLDRIGDVLAMLAERPLAGRGRPELANAMRSFPVGRYVLFYQPTPDGIDLVRVLNGYRDIGPDDFST